MTDYELEMCEFFGCSKTELPEILALVYDY